MDAFTSAYLKKKNQSADQASTSGSFTQQYLRAKETTPKGGTNLPALTEVESSMDTPLLRRYLQEISPMRDAVESVSQQVPAAEALRQRNAARESAQQRLAAERQQEEEKADWGGVLKGTVLKGADQAATALTSTASWLEGALLKPVGALLGDPELYERGPLNMLNDTMQEAAQSNQERFAPAFESAGRAGELLDKYGTATVAAIPQAALAMMSAGASLGAQGTAAGLQAAGTAAQSGLAQSIGTAVRNMAKNPQYWLSFLQGAGSDYEAAKQDGANELQATAYALLSNMVSSAVEIGGGIDTLPQNLREAARGGKSALREWVGSMIDEGREEVIQGAVSQLAQTLYGRNNPFFSLTDENAVISPGRAAEEFAGGAVVGGILGGGQMAASRAIDAIGRRNSASFDAQSPEGEDPYSHPAQAETAAEGPIRAGNATTIYHPYQGTKPVQAQKNTAAIHVDSGSVRTAENRIQGARGLSESLPGQGFKAALKNIYKSVFQPAKGVPVEGVTFEGKPYTVDINNNVPGKVISDPNLTAEKLALLDILPDVVRAGEYVGSGEYVPHGSRTKPVIRYDYFEAPILIDGKDYLAKFDVEVYPGANNYRTHQIVDVDLTPTEARLAGPTPVPSSEVLSPLLNSTIAQGADSVNRGVMEQEVQRLFSETARGQRVPQSTLNEAQIDELSKQWEQGTAGLDASGNVFRANPDEHIDKRTRDGVGSRSINAFQFDWPELQPYMRQAAESLLRDADLSLQTVGTRRSERTTGGKRYIQSITESPALREAMNMGLTRDQIITAAQALIADSGQENYAAAKRLELVLDSMLTNGYTTVSGESVGPNEAYIRAKNRISGAEPSAQSAEELPIWDMKEPAVEADVPQSVGAAARGFDPYTNQLRQFGAIPEGENPARPIDVPARTAPDNRVSRTARTILEAAATPDSAVGDIGQAVVDGQFSYMPVTNETARQRAEQTIERKGWENALADWRADVRAGKASEQITALGATLYNNAVNAGDTKAALDIAYDMSVAIRNGARATQAARILKTLTPSGKLYMLQKEVSQLNEDLTKRLTGQTEIQIDEALADAYLNAATDEARNAALQAIYQDIADQIPASFREKWNAWRYMAMLANPRTHVRNVAGNIGFQPLRMTKNLVATAIETGLNAAGVPVERTRSFVAAPDLYRAAWADYDNVSDVLGGTKYNDAQSQINDRRRIFDNRALEAIRRGNTRTLELEDVLFKRITYADTLAGYLQANGVTAEQLRSGQVEEGLLQKARDYAAQEALKATYQDRNSFSNRVNRIAKDFGAVGEAILPFRRTPANILVRGMEYSPAGLAKALTYDLYQVQRGNKTAAQAIDGIASGLTGSALMALGAYLFSEGLVTTGGGDSEDDEWKELLGHQSYALELPNGTSVTLDWLAPESLPFFMGVELASSMGESGMDAESIYNALRSVANPMLELSMLQSVNDLIDSVQYAEEAPLAAMIPSAVISYFSQAIPTIGGQIERTGEESRMSTYTDRNSPIPTDVQYALGRASSRIPGWDYQQTPYIDAWGREESSGSEIKRFVNNFFNPAYVSQVEVDAVEQELQRLRDATGDTSVFPDRAARYIMVDGERRDLSAEEYDTYARTLGQTRYRMVSGAMNMAEYRSMSNSEKADYIGDLYEYANAVAKAEVSDYQLEGWIKNASTAQEEIGVSPAEYIALYQKYGSSLMSGSGYEKLQEAVDNGLTIEQYVEYREQTAGLTADKDENGNSISGSKKEKVLEAIDGMDLRPEEKDWLYYLNGYAASGIDEAPWRQRG